MPAPGFFIAIPARRQSSRLPDKLLLAETGKPVLQHTIERAFDAAAMVGMSRQEARDCITVACDDPALADVATRCGIKAVLVTEPCDSGTERIVRALPHLPACDVLVNLQADEPCIPAQWIVDCLRACREAPEVDVVTVAVPLQAGDPAIDNMNAVKVVLDHRSFALYFSRAPIPAVRQGGQATSPRAFRHIGLYAYSTGFLKRYFSLPPSELEQSECLEQLRFLQAGARIQVIIQREGDLHGRGIDTAEDYREFVGSHQLAQHERLGSDAPSQ